MRKRRLAAEEEEEGQSSLVHKYIKRKRLEKGGSREAGGCTEQSFAVDIL